MANTYASLYYHIVFSTKRRQPFLMGDLQDRVWAYLGGIARENKMTAIAVGGMSDHTHILLWMRPTQVVSKAVQLLKGGSSLWIHRTLPHVSQFAWQDGYGAFTVCRRHTEDVEAYIRNQKEHHRGMTFREEYLEFLKEHGVEFDERYVWD
jgi:REP element-mobilizing transposase RayT